MKVFISYRREDSAGHTGRLYDTLRARWGAGNVFLDVSGIDSGRKFADVIRTAVQSCDVVLAVIGPEWLTCEAGGQRRIDDPADLVRTEILTAFAGDVPVIPVLVGGAAPLPASALPGPLKPLAALDAHDMTDERWSYDADRLVEAMQKIARVPAAGPRRLTVRGFALLAAILAIGAVLAWRTPATAPPVPTPAPAGNPGRPGPGPAGAWRADVTYPWGATHAERLDLRVEGTALSGTASFLGIPRAIVAGTIEGDRIAFETHTQEVVGDFSQPRDVVHRYRGRIAGATITFSMLSDSSGSQQPVAFVATRP